MKRLLSAIVLAFALSFSASAFAGIYTYAQSSYWSAGQTGASYFSSGWYRNAFNKPQGGFDTTVTFIDNVSYSWHATVRNASTYTYTNWLSSQVKKGHCRANAWGRYGACTVFS